MNTYDFALETKSVGDEGRFQGHASTFGNIDYGGDVCEPGCFIEAIVARKKDGLPFPLLWDHNPAEPIGVVHALAEDAKGLFVDAELLKDECPLAKRTYALMKRKAIGGMSIGYRLPPGGRVEDDKRRGVYRLKTVDLREISLVTMPMNPMAKISAVKTIWDAGNQPTVRQFEELLRDAGVSKSLAISLAKAVAPILRRESEQDEASCDPAAFLQALKAGLTL